MNIYKILSMKEEAGERAVKYAIGILVCSYILILVSSFFPKSGREHPDWRERGEDQRSQEADIMNER